MAFAAYRSSTGDARMRQWAVLVGHGTDPSTSTEAFLRTVGPAQDLAVADLPATAVGINDQFNDHHLDWLFAQEAINPPIDPPLPCPE